MGNAVITDVFYKLIHHSGMNEAERHDALATVNEHFSDVVNGMSDEDKANRPAKFDRLAGQHPSLVGSGGMTQSQVNAIVAQAIQDYEASRENSAAQKAQPPMNSGPAVADETAAQPVSFDHVQAAPSKPAYPAADTSAKDATPTEPAEVDEVQEKAAYEKWKAEQQRSKQSTTVQ